MRITTAGTALLLTIVLLCGCARKKRVRTPAPPKIGQTEVGIASWYGHPYHGRRAANGEVYDMEKMTAAHRTLPFGTWVEVENLSNRRHVAVRITDRGPFIGGRIIDLSRIAAENIAMIGPGTAKVRLKIVAAPRDLPEEDIYSVQVAALQDRGRAEKMRRAMEEKFGGAMLVERTGNPTLWRVLVGQEPTLPGAQILAERIRREFGAAFVVRMDQAGN